MLFHLELITRENFGPIDAPTAQMIVMDQINVIMESGKVRESGVYDDERGGFFIIDVDTPEELSLLLSPMMDVACITSHPSSQLIPCRNCLRKSRTSFTPISVSCSFRTSFRL